MANCMNLNQFKGYSSCATKARLTKLDVHHIIIVIHIQYKFHDIPFSGYLAMAPDGRTDMDKTIPPPPPPSAGIKMTQTFKYEIPI